MYRLIISTEAKEDIQAAAFWYENRRLGLGKQFTQNIRAQSLAIRQNPGIFALRYDKVRTAVLEKFPYMIHFSVDEAGKTIIILGVFHTSQDPGHWKDRQV